MINKGSYTFYPVMESGNTDKVAYWQALWAGGHLGYFTTDGELMEHLVSSKGDKYMEPMMEQAAQIIKEGLDLNELPDSQNLVLSVINGEPGKRYTESDKQAFRASLTRLHENGQYMAFSKKQDKWIIGSKNRDMLARQIGRRDEIVNSIFERI